MLRVTNQSLEELDAVSFSFDKKVVIQVTVEDSDRKRINKSIVNVLYLLQRCLQQDIQTKLVIPYYFYSRQDKKTSLQEPLACIYLYKLFVSLGAKRIITVELHNNFLEQLPFVTHIKLTQFFSEFIRERYANCVLVSPDTGGVERVSSISEKFNFSYTYAAKRRGEEGNIEELVLYGDVCGRYVVFIDDIIDSGSTLDNACALAKKKGAKRTICICTHGVLSGKTKFENIDELYTTNTFPSKLDSGIIDVSWIYNEASNSESQEYDA